jgi:hypothetical protein
MEFEFWVTQAPLILYPGLPTGEKLNLLTNFFNFKIFY